MGESIESAERAGADTAGAPDPRPRRAGRARTVAGAVALVLAAAGATAVGVQLLGTDDSRDLVSLQSVDFADEPDGPVASDDGWTAEVAGSVLRLRAVAPGAMQPFWTASPATDAMTVSATLDLPPGVAGDDLFVGGITVLGESGAGWGVACGSDGDAYVLAVWDGRSQALDRIADAGCDGERVDLELAAARSGERTDTIEVRLPDGGRVVLKPGEVRGPFTGAGFVMASADRTLTVPGLDVRTYEVRVEPAPTNGAGS
ncbi:hypothetical protein [Agromyces indicus]|uniref:Uncharacterized protein n=1 Tax=Agromyces indicus TaxID=758919 RepID=A0ABU1FMC8_9MICO|nr:hypothetical protein [Agromyces indicus]MDR5692915.1 hypothetical protein [Agromyces indicus]